MPLSSCPSPTQTLGLQAPSYTHKMIHHTCKSRRKTSPKAATSKKLPLHCGHRLPHMITAGPQMPAQLTCQRITAPYTTIVKQATIPTLSCQHLKHKPELRLQLQLQISTLNPALNPKPQNPKNCVYESRPSFTKGRGSMNRTNTAPPLKPAC